MKRALSIVAILSALACIAGTRYHVAPVPYVRPAATSTPTGPWAPTYAIRMGLTNLNQYTDTGLYVQQNWAVKMLVNIRSNPVGYHYLGVSLSTSDYYFFGKHTSGYWLMQYGNGTSSQTLTMTNGWHYISVAATNLNVYLYTNASLAVSVVNGSAFATNTTKTFYLGLYNNGSASRCPNWDVARLQLIDNMGTLKQDLIATGSGTFTNAIGGATFTFGVSGTGGTSTDSTNVTGQTFPTMNWAAGGGKQ